MQAQQKVHSADQRKSIEINNSNGNLLIAFENDEITKFIVNDSPVAKDRYDDYQEIIDNFSDEEVKSAITVSPEPESDKDGYSEELKSQVLSYLMNEGFINSATKYIVKLKRESLEVNRKEMSKEVHLTCLDFFEDIYGQQLNSESEVKYKRSGDKSNSSVRIVE